MKNLIKGIFRTGSSHNRQSVRWSNGRHGRAKSCMISEVLGCANNPKDIQTAIQNATPEQMMTDKTS